jgi:TRAP-type uncharacterized transport system fused permease subunit
MTDDFNPATKFRSLTGAARATERILVFALALVGAAWAGEVHSFLNLTFFKEQFLGLFFALGLAGVFLRVKVRISESDSRVPWYDWLCCAGSLLTGGYIMLMYLHCLSARDLSPERWLLVGWRSSSSSKPPVASQGGPLIWVAVACILYAKFAYIFPGCCLRRLFLERISRLPLS